MSKRKPDLERIDDENPEWTEAMAAEALRFSQLPASLQTKLRGPQRAPTKERITIRVSREVLEYFRATGKGWQTRMDAELLDLVHKHKSA